MQELRWESSLTDADLVKVTRWPLGLSASEIREHIATAERYIDYDDTLALASNEDRPRPCLRDPFCGRPLRAFLAEKPFLIQSNGMHGLHVWTFIQERRHEIPEGFRDVFEELFPADPFPRPLLIISPPTIWKPRLPGEPRSRAYCDDLELRQYKDLYAIGVRRGEVYDDLGPCVYAPGCTVISEF